MEPDAPSPAAPPTPPPAPPQRRGDRTLPIVLLLMAAVVGAVLAALRGNTADSLQDKPEAAARPEQHAAAVWTPSPRPMGETVSLTIDFGNGARREFAELPYTAGMTLGDLMQRARAFHPGIEFTQTGEGEMAFLTSLEGVANETGTDGRYWLYRVEGEPGQVSFAVHPLAPRVAVLWEFRRGE